MGVPHTVAPTALFLFFAAATIGAPTSVRVRIHESPSARERGPINVVFHNPKDAHSGEPSQLSIAGRLVIPPDVREVSRTLDLPDGVSPYAFPGGDVRNRHLLVSKPVRNEQEQGFDLEFWVGSATGLRLRGSNESSAPRQIRIVYPNKPTDAPWGETVWVATGPFDHFIETLAEPLLIEVIAPNGEEVVSSAELRPTAASTHTIEMTISTNDTSLGKKDSSIDQAQRRWDIVLSDSGGPLSTLDSAYLPLAELTVGPANAPRDAAERLVLNRWDRAGVQLPRGIASVQWSLTVDSMNPKLALKGVTVAEGDSLRVSLPVSFIAIADCPPSVAGFQTASGQRIPMQTTSLATQSKAVKLLALPPADEPFEFHAVSTSGSVLTILMSPANPPGKRLWPIAELKPAP